MTTDTTYTDPRSADFPATGELLVWRTSRGDTMFSKVYRPSADTLAWDKPRLAPAGGEALAVGSRFGGFSYVQLRRTGRKLTRATGSDLYGLRCQVAMNIGPDSSPEDRRQVPAWIVPGKD